MSVMDKFLNAMKLNDEDDEYYDDDFYDDEPEPVKKPGSMRNDISMEDDPPMKKSTPKVLNLEGLDVDIAQRIIDFTSGSCFAISGNLQKISHYIFIITPASVDISGDFQEILSGSFDVPINNGI